MDRIVIAPGGLANWPRYPVQACIAILLILTQLAAFRHLRELNVRLEARPV